MTPRKRAWRTRRAKYGPRGHCGTYSRGPHASPCERMTSMLVRLHAEGVLSEGQVARATGLHRTDIRRRADARGQQPTKDSSMNCDLNKLNVLSYANGFTLWHYTTEDAAADVVATNQETAP